MDNESTSAYVLEETQPTELYLQAVAIICNALENNDKQVKNAYKFIEQCEQENKKLCDQLQNLEEQFITQDEPQKKLCTENKVIKIFPKKDIKK